MTPVVLVVEDESILASSISVYLERHGCSTIVAGCGEDGIRASEEASPDVALVDVRLPGMDGIQVLQRLREVTPATEVVIMTAHASVASAVQAIKLGAFDYLTKPVDLDELRLVVDKAATHQRMRLELSYLRGRRGGIGAPWEIVGESPPMRQLLQQIERIAALDSPDGGGAPTVLILGETGTGKEMVARALHDRSPAPRGRSSRSTAPPSRGPCSRPSCSATSGAPTRTRAPPRPGSSRRPTTARSCWTRSATRTPPSR
jgi:DNA-binding NtrC family response regulator